MKTLEERFWPKVKKTETCWEWIAALAFGYGYFNVNGSMRRAHRVSYELANGPIPDGMVIDHICRNKACVNPEHLRPTTTKQNSENRSGAMQNSRTGVRGVHYRPDRKKYQAMVGHEGKVVHVGYFTSLADAEAAVVAKRNELFTHSEVDKEAA